MSQEKVRVTVVVVGGVAHVIECPDFVALDLRDYDVEGSDERVERDENGDFYFQRGKL